MVCDYKMRFNSYVVSVEKNMITVYLNQKTMFEVWLFLPKTKIYILKNAVNIQSSTSKMVHFKARV